MPAPLSDDALNLAREFVADLQKKRGIVQDDVGDLIGIHQSRVSVLMTRKGGIGATPFLRLARLVDRQAEAMAALDGHADEAAPASEGDSPALRAALLEMPQASDRAREEARAFNASDGVAATKETLLRLMRRVDDAWRLAVLDHRETEAAATRAAALEDEHEKSKGKRPKKTPPKK